MALLQARELTKTFGSVRALDAVFAIFFSQVGWI
jgi:hypothetical protein